MRMFRCAIPRADFSKAKDFSILIFNKLRKLNTEATDFAIQRHIGKVVRTVYEQHSGTKPVLEILQEYYDKIKERS